MIYTDLIRVTLSKVESVFFGLSKRTVTKSFEVRRTVEVRNVQTLAKDLNMCLIEMFHKEQLEGFHITNIEVLERAKEIVVPINSILSN